MIRGNYSILTVGSLLATGSSIFNVAAQNGSQDLGNVLVIVADDLGKEVLSIYDTPTAQRANTPNLDRLAQQGVVFDNFWGSPLSAPVRAAMLTGRYGHHTGIMSLEIELPTSEVTLFEALPDGYSNALIGKWHLSKYLNFAPDYGIDHFAGFAMGGGVANYNSWRFTQNGVTTMSTDYVTTQITNSALEWIGNQKSEWVCWVAYNAPHTPLHLPPKHMHTYKKLKDSEAAIERDPLSYYLAMVESLDYEIGRLLEGVDDSTTVIFVGDNGTDNDLLQSPYPLRHGKGTLYESGISVPMIVAGRGVTMSGERSATAVNAVDIFPTVMEFAGQTMASYEDSFSFAGVVSGGAGQRQYTFSDIYNQRSGYMTALSDGEYKIISTQGGATKMFNLKKDPLEERDLLQGKLSSEDQEAYNRLQRELESMNIPYIAPPSTAAQNRAMGGRPGPKNGNNNFNSNRQKR